MANHLSAKKRVRSSARKNQVHNQIKGQVRSAEKNFRNLIDQKDKEKATKYITTVTSQFDKASQKGTYSKNKSARKKSQMHRLLKTLN